MFGLIALSLALAACKTSPPPADTGALHLGPLVPGMSIEAAIAAIPDVEWTVAKLEPGSFVIGARAREAVIFAGRNWDVRIGTMYETYFPSDYRFRATLRKDIDGMPASACKAAFHETVRAIEAQLGPLGSHPEFGDPRSRLFSRPFSFGAFQQTKAGDFSRARQTPVESGYQTLLSQREPRPGFDYVVTVEASISNSAAPMFHDNCILEARVEEPKPGY